MAIWLDHRSKVIVQGMTGGEGRKHTARMVGFGTRIVAGVTPGKGGTALTVEEDPIPVYNTVREARHATGAGVSAVFVPPANTKSAVLDAIAAGIGLIVCITEGVPVKDTAYFNAAAQEAGVRLIGPNCPGLITPDEVKIGIMPGHIHRKGRIGVVSRSGTLTYEAVGQLTEIGLGQSSAVGTGGDPIIGTTHIDCLAAFEADPDTDAIVMIGEIGGDAEERAAAYIAEHVRKPVVGYVAGFTAPEGKTMGHAGAIVSGSSGTALAKKRALEANGVRVGQTPSQTAQLVREVIREMQVSSAAWRG